MKENTMQRAKESRRGRVVVLIQGMILLVFCLCATQVMAHKIRIFAWLEGDLIMGESAFSGGRSPKGVEIDVYPKGEETVIAKAVTDEQGNFSLPVSELAAAGGKEILLVIDTGDGHRAEWTMTAEEYGYVAQAKVEDKGTGPDAEKKETAVKKRIDVHEGVSMTSVAAGLALIFAGAFAIQILRKKRG